MTLEELPKIPDEAAARVRAALKAYRKAAELSEAKERAAVKLQHIYAGKMKEAQEAEARTYARLVDALQLLGEYRVILRKYEQNQPQ